MFDNAIVSSAGRCVLVVDDDQAIRETLRLVLEDAGYAVLEAADGVVALAILRQSLHPLVVLLDSMMPRLDGLGVLRAVDDDSRLAFGNAYILITANLRVPTPPLSRLLTRLDVEVVRKPFDIDLLLDRVERAAARLPATDLHDPRGTQSECPTLQ